jgi:intracellular proteinase inhibitor BsuPI
MSSRSLIPLLLVAAVVFACGPRTHSEATPKKDSALVILAGAAATTPTTPRARSSADPKKAVEAQIYVHATESSVRVALHVVNNGKKRVELNFPTGQTYEFTILDSLGREVWRWGKGRMFTQALRNKLLGGGEALDVEETLDDAQLAPGRYIARATLTSENFPLTQQTEFTIDRATIAAR